MEANQEVDIGLFYGFSVVEEWADGLFPSHLDVEEFVAKAQPGLIEELVLLQVVFAVSDIVGGNVDKRLIHNADVRHQCKIALSANIQVANDFQRDLEVAAFYNLFPSRQKIKRFGIVRAFVKHVVDADFGENVVVSATYEKPEGARQQFVQMVVVRQLAVAEGEVGAEVKAVVQVSIQFFVFG